MEVILVIIVHQGEKLAERMFDVSNREADFFFRVVAVEVTLVSIESERNFNFPSAVKPSSRYVEAQLLKSGRT